jgi:RNA polymerase sigma-32 factor
MTSNLLALNSLSPGRDLNGYVQTVSAFPILSVEEEKALAERFYYQQDLEAARKLVLCHLRFVVHVARSYAGYGLSQADLIQEGNVGLMKAVKRYNPEVGVRLVSFAVHWIRAEMHEFILRNWRIVKVATTKAQRKLFFNLRSSKAKLGWLNQAETEAVARDLGVAPEVVTQMEGRLAAHDMAFDGESDDDDEAWTAPSQYLEADGADPADVVADEQQSSTSSEVLGTALRGLDARSRDILESRWLTDDKATLHELAERYGVSAERIRQLEKNALKKLKQAMQGEAIEA